MGKKKKHPHPEVKPGEQRLADVDLSAHVSDEDDYEKELKRLQQRVFALQIEYFLSGKRAVFAFEGWDAAGKGGTIKRLTELMDPRGLKVWPISAPRDEERRQHYLWRFWTRLPDKGTVAVFDRTWYGRVLVERVEGFCTKAEWKRAFDEINQFEKTLTDDGVRLTKFFLHIDRKTQLKRFEAREGDPFKRYKIGPEDWRNRKRWNAYLKAIDEMLERTDTAHARWHVVAANDKRHARLEVLRRAVKLLEGKSL